MQYNSIQSFIADLDERMQELSDYENRKTQRRAVENSSTVTHKPDRRFDNDRR